MRGRKERRTKDKDILSMGWISALKHPPLRPSKIRNPKNDRWEDLDFSKQEMFLQALGLTSNSETKNCDQLCRAMNVKPVKILISKEDQKACAMKLHPRRKVMRRKKKKVQPKICTKCGIYCESAFSLRSHERNCGVSRCRVCSKRLQEGKEDCCKDIGERILRTRQASSGNGERILRSRQSSSDIGERNLRSRRASSDMQLSVYDGGKSKELEPNVPKVEEVESTKNYDRKVPDMFEIESDEEECLLIGHFYLMRK